MMFLPSHLSLPKALVLSVYLCVGSVDETEVAYYPEGSFHIRCLATGRLDWGCDGIDLEGQTASLVSASSASSTRAYSACFWL